MPLRNRQEIEQSLQSELRSLRRLAMSAIFLSIVTLVVFVTFAMAGIGEKKIGFVRSADLILNNQAMEETLERFNNKKEAWQQSIASLEQQLQTTIENYETEQSTLDERQLLQRREELSEQRRSLLEYVHTVSRKSQEEEASMVKNVLERINDFAKRYGEEQRFDLIMGTTTEGNILYGVDAIDLTDEFLTALDHDYVGGE